MSDNENFNQDTGRIILPTQGNSVHVPITATDNKTRCEAIIKTHVIPVIFLPGIMGTSLKKKGNADQDSDFKNYLWHNNLDNFINMNVSNTTIAQDMAKKVIEAANKDDSEKIWKVFKPINFKALGYILPIFGSAEARQKKLNPEKVVVDYCCDVKKGPGIFSNDKDIDLAVALMRGWGSVMGDYWKLLIQLQKTLDEIPYHPDKACEDINKVIIHNEMWQQVIQGGKEKYQPWYQNPKNKNKLSQNLFFGKSSIDKQLQPINIKHINHVASYQYIVYASGYNWLNSNYNSANGGERVIENYRDVYQGNDRLEYVVEQILNNVKLKDPTCEKVILVTHSMGGLVARAYQAKHQEKVLGIVHGVMPATGAATMYKRLRAGFGGIESTGGLFKKIGNELAASALGNDGYETSVIMTHAVGALELAPSDTYGKGESNANLTSVTGVSGIHYDKWLQVYEQGQSTPIMVLPQEDPYIEIYSKSYWYGLVPTYSKDKIPATNQQKQKGLLDSNRRIDPLGEFNYYDPRTKEYLPELIYLTDNVTKAREFYKIHLKDRPYHPNTYACCIIDTQQQYNAFGRIELKIQTSFSQTASYQLNKATLDQFVLTDDNKKGSWQIANKQGNSLSLTIAEKSDAGDETVPGISAIAPAEHIKELWQISDGEHDHQGSWTAKNAQMFCLYAITKIVQEDKRTHES